jgi:hypothetical protein
MNQFQYEIPNGQVKAFLVQSTGVWVCSLIVLDEWHNGVGSSASEAVRGAWAARAEWLAYKAKWMLEDVPA